LNQSRSSRTKTTLEKPPKQEAAFFIFRVGLSVWTRTPFD